MQLVLSNFRVGRTPKHPLRLMQNNSPDYIRNIFSPLEREKKNGYSPIFINFVAISQRDDLGLLVRISQQPRCVTASSLIAPLASRYFRIISHSRLPGHLSGPRSRRTIPGLHIARFQNLSRNVEAPLAARTVRPIPVWRPWRYLATLARRCAQSSRRRR